MLPFPGTLVERVGVESLHWLWCGDWEDAMIGIVDRFMDKHCFMHYASKAI
jgi:hypothetical protein